MSVSSDDDHYQDWGQDDSNIYTAIRAKDSSKTPMMGSSLLDPTPDFNQKDRMSSSRLMSSQEKWMYYGQPTRNSSIEMQMPQTKIFEKASKESYPEERITTMDVKEEPKQAAKIE